MDADFLLTRGEDLALIGVRLHGFEPGDDPLEMTAVAGARIVLHLPPQHVLEQTVEVDPKAPALPADDFVARSQLAGTSRIAYEIAGGTTVKLDGEGILGACTALAPTASSPGPFDTAIELPWRLVFAPDLKVGARPQHAPGALASPDGVVGLWLTRLLGSLGSGASPDDALALLPVDPDAANFQDPGFSIALDGNARSQIVVNGRAVPPRSGPVELTALGGSLAVHGEWEGFRWSHRTTLGRDQAVVVVEQVRGYPFGHRGILTTITVRDPDAKLPGGPSVPPGGTLALRTVRTLEFPEPVVRADGPVFSRTFPFSEVELTTTHFAGLGKAEDSYTYYRPTPALEELRKRREDAESALPGLEAEWRPETAAVTLDDLIRGEFEPATRWSNLNAELAQAREARGSSSGSSASVGALQTQLENAERNLARLEAGEIANPDGSISPAVQAARENVDTIRAMIREAEAGGAGPDPGLDARIGELEAAAGAAYAECEPYLHGERTVEELAGIGNQAAIDWLAKGEEIRVLAAEIAQLESLASTPHEVSVWPKDLSGRRMRFPVRLRRGEQIVDVSMPLLLVKDFTLPVEASVPAYVSLEDPLLARELDRAWGEPLLAGDEPEDVDTVSSGTVAVPGLLLDVVGSANPQPEDVQVVRGLNIFGGAPFSDPFVPTLGRAADAERGAQRSAMWIDLPAVRTLLGKATPAPAAPADPSAPPVLSTPAPSGTPVSFAREFLDRGEAAELLFKADREIGVDFTSAADRSGGLTALQLAADGISRERGPVQAATLTSTDPAQAIGLAATLLGFKLQDLLFFKSTEAEPLPLPPEIVTELADGEQPVVRMSWTERPLKDFLALRTFPTEKEPGRRSRLSLEVASAPDSVKTTGDVHDFMLVFPPSENPLLQLTFARLSYAQETTGGVATPPRVGVEGFEVEFLGPLELLKKLQDAVDLGGGPRVQPTPSGVTATFSVPVPNVTCVAFSLSNLVFHSAVEVPFNGDPVAVSIGFASRAAPFAVSVLTFSGGGYIDIRVDAKGPRIEASLEFGASMSVDFLVASGEVHALGGVRYLQQGDSVGLTGYVRIGGSVEVLGLVSASIELVVQLSYEGQLRRLEGRATLVLELDLTLWSDSVEIDSGPWILAGGDGAAPAQRALPVGEGFDDDAVFEAIDAQPAEEELTAWRNYRQALAGRGSGVE